MQFTLNWCECSCFLFPFHDCVKVCISCPSFYDCLSLHSPSSFLDFPSLVYARVPISHSFPMSVFRLAIFVSLSVIVSLVQSWSYVVSCFFAMMNHNQLRSFPSWVPCTPLLTTHCCSNLQTCLQFTTATRQYTTYDCDCTSRILYFLFAFHDSLSLYFLFLFYNCPSLKVILGA